MSKSANRRIVLASRPTGAPTPDNFRIETQAVPVLAQGQILIRTIYLSLDPYMRGRMSDAPSYAPPVAISEVMVGSTVSRVEISHHPDFAVGDWVLSQNGWQEYAISDGKGIFNLGAQMEHPSYALGVLGMPGFTAYMGLLEIGQPVAGETVVVAAATGAVGSVVPLEESQRMVDALKKAGAQDVKLTVYPEAGHDSWTEAYNNPQLYEWLLKHDRRK